eukprot:TRINITY_DN1121_c0_g1_i1.p1 TRINITY_DN1121_c0_g1~~TRINITY_DN1121_c0_g1_i1.p1  ORF type:complete len:155 (-),score=30.10 TRINITY_DN1121_c0_g1_i1:106-570(-)
MDSQKKTEKHWYFFRQRMKRQKVQFQYQQRLVLETYYENTQLRFQLNSTLHSLSLSLSQISLLHNSIDKFRARLNIALVQIETHNKIIKNLKGQIQLLEKQKMGKSSNLVFSNFQMDPTIDSSPQRKRRKLMHDVCFAPIVEGDMSGYEGLDLF